MYADRRLAPARTRRSAMRHLLAPRLRLTLASCALASGILAGCGVQQHPIEQPVTGVGGDIPPSGSGGAAIPPGTGGSPGTGGMIVGVGGEPGMGGNGGRAGT